MHELAIAHSLVRSASEAAQRNGGRRVAVVVLALGSLSGVEPEALAFCFPLAAEGTVCEGAELRIERVQAAGRCPSCARTSPVDHLMTPCQGCGHWPLEVQGGRELDLRSLEVD